MRWSMWSIAYSSRRWLIQIMLHLNLFVPLLLFSLSSQTFRHAFIPGYHVLVGIQGKALARQYLREDSSRIVILHIPFRNGFAQEARMLFWAEQKLNGLPHDPSFRFERRHGRVGEGGLVGVM